MTAQQLAMPLAEPSSSRKVKTGDGPAAKNRQNTPMRNFEVKHPDDAKRCSVCGTFGSLFEYQKGKPYCQGTDWGKASCAPRG